MDLGSAVKVLLRRWIVVLVGLLLTVGGAAYLYLSAPPSYTAGARMLLLLPPNARGADAVGSPFLYLPDGLNVIGRLVSVSATTREFREAMAAEGLTSGYQVTVDPQNPIVVIAVEGPDPEDVLATRDWMVGALQEELLAVQVEEGAPEAQIAHARVFAAEERPVEQGNARLREVIGVLGMGGVVTLLAAFGVDRLFQQRRARRATTDLR